MDMILIIFIIVDSRLFMPPHLLRAQGYAHFISLSLSHTHTHTHNIYIYIYIYITTNLCSTFVLYLLLHCYKPAW